MTATVTINSSGRRFDVEQGESVLEAALRAGLSVSYSCNSGTCGKCKARVLAGDPGAGLPRDYPFSEAERAAGTVLMCRTLPATDLLLDVSEIAAAGEIPEQEARTMVSRIERATDDVAVLHLRTPRTQTLQFLAGQHVRLRLDESVERHKSIASCPCNGMLLQFHVRRVPGDPFSEHVFERLRPRQEVVVRGPYGEFQLDERSTRPIIFVAFETGFAPIKSLIEHATSLELDQPMELYWVARHESDHYLFNYCRSLADAMDNLRFAPVISEQAHGAARSPAEAERDMVTAARAVARDHPDLSGHDVYVNGPEAILADTRAMLLEYGLAEDRLFIDRIERI